METSNYIVIKLTDDFSRPFTSTNSSEIFEKVNLEIFNRYLKNNKINKDVEVEFSVKIIQRDSKIRVFIEKELTIFQSAFEYDNNFNPFLSEDNDLNSYFYLDYDSEEDKFRLLMQSFHPYLNEKPKFEHILYPDSIWGNLEIVENKLICNFPFPDESSESGILS